MLATCPLQTHIQVSSASAVRFAFLTSSADTANSEAIRVSFFLSLSWSRRLNNLPGIINWVSLRSWIITALDNSLRAPGPADDIWGITRHDVIATLGFPSYSKKRLNRSHDGVSPGPPSRCMRCSPASGRQRSERITQMAHGG